MNAAARPISAQRPTRVFYHHLHKCGGSTLSAWLDQQLDDDRCWSMEWTSNGYAATLDGRQPALDIPALASLLRRRGITAFHCSDIIRDHQAIGCYAPPGTLRFTVLREPVSRLLSQVADWRRLDDGDNADIDPALHDCYADARRLRLAPFLERHGHGGLRHLLDNYLVRSIASTRLGPAVLLIERADDLAAVARLSLEQDYEMVGITEQAARTRRVLCRRMGWAPAPDVPRLNATGAAAAMRVEAAEATAILAELTVHDRALYARAGARFAAEDDQWDTATFEAEAASARLAQLRGQWWSGRTVFSVRGMLIGHGWHGRDGAGTAECAVWTGPERHTTLYIPVPPGQDITVYLWVRGYAAAAQRDAISLHIDGRPVAHRFEPQDGYTDVIAADTITTRDFVRLQIEAGDPVSSGTPGDPDYEPRLRGLAFDRYGWALR